MIRYNPKEIEPKWQQQWEQDGVYNATEDPAKPKKYILEFFPYPSGAAMHVGHVRNYTIGDVTSRYWRMKGYNVLHPMGWDAFGLPAENYAIKTGISPQKAVADNVEHFKRQLTQMGFGYDWQREINSTDPAYYKWTQWLFTILFKRGLAYQSENLQWWCEGCKTVLANEQVVNGKCWRHDGASDPLVKKRPLRQWFFKITDYAERLLGDLDDLDWSESIKAMQRNWIGKSKGAEVDFALKGSDASIRVFTTRPDTLYGATFLVIAPEHPLVESLTTDAQRGAVMAYIQEAMQKDEVDRMDENRPKTGVDTGAYAISPLSGEPIPIWIADYVLMGYGTGAIMAVPAHDMRDWDFAMQHHLPVVRVIDNDAAETECSADEGLMINSGLYDGLQSSQAREQMVADLQKKGIAQEKVNYRIRDWLISRQRYWGAPIPIVWVDDAVRDFGPEVAELMGGHVVTKQVDGTTYRAVPLPLSQLPAELPEVTNYEPDGSGKSPLARAEEWAHVWFDTQTADTQPYSSTKPVGSHWVEAWRETDTMDGFACSSWYFLRFADPNNQEAAFDRKKADFWLPVDTYIGGAEHAVMHLLYARMWTKVMFDEGLIDFTEPFTALKNQGMILAPDGSKMSKSKGNTIAPDDLIEQGYGADAIRIMEMFIGPWNQSANWSVEGMGGSYRFLNRVWTIVQDFLASSEKQADPETAKQLRASMHKAIKKVSLDMQDFGFNTAVAGLMEYVNELYKIKEKSGISRSEDWQQALRSLLQLLAPFAPHISEELWQRMQQQGSVHTSQWPEWDEAYLVRDIVTIAVQVNGKLRGTVEVSLEATEADITKKALALPRVSEHLAGAAPKKTIYIPHKLLNLVV